MYVNMRGVSRFVRGVLGAVLIAAGTLPAQPPSARPDRVVFLVLDGVRSEEFFIGRSPYRKKRGPHLSKEKLLPFVWTRLASHADSRVFGNRFAHRNRRDYCKINNTYGVSLPAYADLLSGLRQSEVRSNDFDGPSPTATIPDQLIDAGVLPEEIAVFASWANIRHVASREAEPEFYVSTGLREDDVEPRWSNARHDADLFDDVRAYVEEQDALRYLFIAFNDSDEWAHLGDYPRYIKSIRRQDEFIRKLYDFLESRDDYRGRTAYFITTDHGRGRGKHWRNHGRVPGSQYIWALVHTPGSPPPADLFGDDGCSHVSLAQQALEIAGRKVSLR